MNDEERRPRLLVFIVAYEAEATIEPVLRRIPATLAALAEVEILVIDDASSDRTVALADAMRQAGTLPWYGLEYALDDFLVYAFYGHKREHSAQIAAFRDRLERL